MFQITMLLANAGHMFCTKTYGNLSGDITLAEMLNQWPLEAVFTSPR